MIAGLDTAQVAALLFCGVLLDLMLGEARRWHPLVGFGNLANVLERSLNRGRWRLARGGAAWMTAVLPLTALAALLSFHAGLAAHALMLYFCLGLRSLRDHNLPIAQALSEADLPRARLLTARIVSRDTANAGAGELASASAESLLENGNDAVFGTLFWFAVAGGPGALLFRLANTLDAMWGYRSSRFILFGRVAARMDDALNYLPARLTALSYVLLARDPKLAWRCWRLQAPHWPSPNAGPVMSSGAGALGLALGGRAVYGSVEEMRPVLGAGRPAVAGDILRAWRLVRSTTALWLAAAVAVALNAWLWGIFHA